MTDPIAAAPSREEQMVACAGRATMYSLLAYGLATPGPDRWRAIEESLLPAATMLLLPGPVAAALDGLAEAAPASWEELAEAHLLLFPPVAHQDAPGYETAYRGDDLFRQMDLLADVAGFYRAHGLRVGGEERERPDHIVVELEFCSLLCRKELHALQTLGPEQVEVCRETMMSFLGDHLACWGPAFGRRSAAVAAHGWYRMLGELTQRWIDADVAALGVTPAEVASDPLPQDLPDDGSCGPCPTGAG
ncbi:MAG: molecular chaperone [Actinomycetota bacterium]